MKFLLLLSALIFFGCEEIEQKKEVISVDIEIEREIVEKYDWDHKADSEKWTKATKRALHTHGKVLLSKKAKSGAAERYCKRFNEMNTQERVVFWTGLISAMARRESNFKPETTYKESFTNNGAPVISTGLLQISYASARGYGFKDATTEKLKDPEYNLAVGVGILNRWFGRDGYIGTKVDGKWLGGARYWSVLRPRKSSESVYIIRKFTRNMEVCN